MNPLIHTLNVFRKAFNFKDRSSRSEYWYFILVTLIIQIALPAILGGTGAIISLIYIVLAFIPSIALQARRLHDVGLTGWLQLLSLTGIGHLVVLFFAVKGSDQGENKFGPQPQ